MKTNFTHRTLMRCAAPLSAMVALGACLDSPQTLVDDEPLGEASQAFITDCEYLDPGRWAAPAIPVDYARELVITDLTVVEDPCRTTWTAGCGPTVDGHWTFGHLMSQMRGTRTTSRFVGEWLDSFMTPGAVNGIPLPARPGFRAQLLVPWLIASGCAPTDPVVGVGACNLNMQLAPFRLLAIVNRIDLSGTIGAVGADPGELRFVFGSVDGAGNAQPATFIFEYKLSSSGGDAFNWSTQFSQLSNMPMGSAAYLNHLQGLTDLVVARGMEPGNPNFGAAIGQVRTNEIAFGPLWSMREFTLQPKGGFSRHVLAPHTTHQTPDNTLLFSATLDTWLAANAPAIETLSHSVPVGIGAVPVIGGESLAPLGFVWNDSAGVLTPTQRHLFGFDTCNGCHTSETGTVFTHIDPRAAGFASGLSPFLAVSTLPDPVNGGSPLSVMSIVDPAGSGLTFEYNEPWRRVCESTRIRNGVAAPYTNGSGAH